MLFWSFCKTGSQSDSISWLSSYSREIHNCHLDFLKNFFRLRAVFVHFSCSEVLYPVDPVSGHDEKTINVLQLDVSTEHNRFSAAGWAKTFRYSFSLSSAHSASSTQKYSSKSLSKSKEYGRRNESMPRTEFVYILGNLLRSVTLRVLLAYH